MERNQMISRTITTQSIKGAFLEEQFGRKVWRYGCDWVTINMNKNIDVVYIKTVVGQHGALVLADSYMKLIFCV